MKSKILFVTTFMLSMVGVSFAAVQNVKVSGSVDSSYVNRQHFNLGAKTSNLEVGLSDQSTLITQATVQIDADLSDNVAAQVSVYNERAWDAEGSTDTNVQLQYANVTLKEFLYSPLTVTVGRQDFTYGNALIIGAAPVAGNFSNIAGDLTMRSAFDGVKAVFDYKPLTLDVLYFRNSSNTTNTGNVNPSANVASKDNDDVYGLNANYQLGDAMNTTVEGYFFGRVNNAIESQTVHTITRADTFYIPGVRVSTSPVKGLTVGGEAAWQLGRVTTHTDADTEDTARRNALALQFMGSYELPVLTQYKPVASGSYTYLSGDKNGSIAATNANQNSGETYTGWDAMMEDQNTGRIFDNILSATNMKIANAGLSVNPLEDLTTAFNWYGVWAAKKYSAENPIGFAQPDGSSVTPVTTSKKVLGHEFDVDVEYAYTEDVTLGLTVGYFLPGKAFSGLNDSTASQAVAHVAVAF